MIFLAFACKKKTTEPEPIVEPTPTPVINTYTFKYYQDPNRTHINAGDTLKMFLNGVQKSVTQFEVKTNDIVKFYYNAGTYNMVADSNTMLLYLDNTVIKSYQCTCIANYSFTVQ